MEALIDWAAADLTLPGQSASGDRYLVRETPGGALVAVVDGLGHGAEAADAAKLTIDALELHASEPIISLFNRCHRRLVGTRGAAMSLALFSARDDTMTWAGVGNVEGVVVRAQAGVSRRRESLLPRGGVVGAHLPALAAAIIRVVPGDTLVFATDGLRSGFADYVVPGEPPRQLADRLLAAYSTRADDALVLVACYTGGVP